MSNLHPLFACIAKDFEYEYKLELARRQREYDKAHTCFVWTCRGAIDDDVQPCGDCGRPVCPDHRDRFGTCMVCREEKR
ncbi:MAG TPA: hypothetical protein VFO46_02250 [Candidatus Sulfotelmatobacter sp.]|nr:hypothetical protein [Candidatus Sulfotelmatobacter sp.]